MAELIEKEACVLKEYKSVQYVESQNCTFDNISTYAITADALDIVTNESINYKANVLE